MTFLCHVQAYSYPVFQVTKACSVVYFVIPHSLHLENISNSSIAITGRTKSTTDSPKHETIAERSTYLQPAIKLLSEPVASTNTATKRFISTPVIKDSNATFTVFELKTMASVSSRRFNYTLNASHSISSVETPSRSPVSSVLMTPHIPSVALSYPSPHQNETLSKVNGIPSKPVSPVYPSGRPFSFTNRISLSKQSAVFNLSTTPAIRSVASSGPKLFPSVSRSEEMIVGNLSIHSVTVSEHDVNSNIAVSSSKDKGTSKCYTKLLMSSVAEVDFSSTANALITGSINQATISVNPFHSTNTVDVAGPDTKVSIHSSRRESSVSLPAKNVTNSIAVSERTKITSDSVKPETSTGKSILSSPMTSLLSEPVASSKTVIQPVTTISVIEKNSAVSSASVSELKTMASVSITHFNHTLNPSHYTSSVETSYQGPVSSVLMTPHITSVALSYPSLHQNKTLSKVNGIASKSVSPVNPSGRPFSFTNTISLSKQSAVFNLSTTLPTSTVASSGPKLFPSVSRSEEMIVGNSSIHSVTVSEHDVNSIIAVSSSKDKGSSKFYTKLLMSSVAEVDFSSTANVLITGTINQATISVNPFHSTNTVDVAGPDTKVSIHSSRRGSLVSIPVRNVTNSIAVSERTKITSDSVKPETSTGKSILSSRMTSLLSEPVASSITVIQPVTTISVIEKNSAVSSASVSELKTMASVSITHFNHTLNPSHYTSSVETSYQGPVSSVLMTPHITSVALSYPSLHQNETLSKVNGIASKSVSPVNPSGPPFSFTNTISLSKQSAVFNLSTTLPTSSVASSGPKLFPSVSRSEEMIVGNLSIHSVTVSEHDVNSIIAVSSSKDKGTSKFYTKLLMSSVAEVDFSSTANVLITGTINQATISVNPFHSTNTVDVAGPDTKVSIHSSRLGSTVSLPAKNVTNSIAVSERSKITSDSVKPKTSTGKLILSSRMTGLLSEPVASSITVIQPVTTICVIEKNSAVSSASVSELKTMARVSI